MNEHHIKEDILNILRVLSSTEGSSQRELSHSLGVSLGKTNYLLKSLVTRGLVEIKNFTIKNQKIRKVKYMLTGKGLEHKLQLTYYFLKRKEKEYLKLKEELEKIPAS
ncbi:MAG: MarR family EPS-associated transcriptional regulator [Candidatus Omnitrophica bacterium]|nr:MarR family EPS-associated transcriptional regulator [Candidatus Omnitrophota bacterium]